VNQYLARYWFAVRAGKIGSPVMRFITGMPETHCAACTNRTRTNNSK
jgi:hypothetical protein